MQINESVGKDTAGAVTGVILGMYWGERHIPEKWRSRVEKGVEISALADEIFLAAGKAGWREEWR